jgi:hypothetical protein
VAIAASCGLARVGLYRATTLVVHSHRPRRSSENLPVNATRRVTSGFDRSLRRPHPAAPRRVHEPRRSGSLDVRPRDGDVRGHVANVSRHASPARCQRRAVWVSPP